MILSQFWNATQLWLVQRMKKKIVKNQKKYCQITMSQTHQAEFKQEPKLDSYTPCVLKKPKLCNFNLCKNKDIKSLLDILASYATGLVHHAKKKSQCHMPQRSQTVNPSVRLPFECTFTKNFSHVVPAVCTHSLATLKTTCSSITNNITTLTTRKPLLALLQKPFKTSTVQLF